MRRTLATSLLLASYAFLTACQPHAVAAPYEPVTAKPLPQVTKENTMATPARQMPQAPDNSIMRTSGDAKMSKP